MSFNELYSDILCALTKDHIVKVPITLGCLHVICNSCLTKGSGTIVCKICGTEQKIIAFENVYIEKLLKKNLPELFNKLEQQISDKIRKLKGISILIRGWLLIYLLFLEIVERRDAMLEATMVFIEEDIEIRIQSLKDELDNLFEELKKEVKSHKEELKRLIGKALNFILNFNLMF